MRSLWFACCVTMLALPALGAPAKPTPAPATPPADPAAEARAQAANLATEVGVLRLENSRLMEEIERLATEAKDAPLIDRENRQLRERIILLEGERTRLEHEKQSMKGWGDGMGIGAVIFAAGLALGVLLSRGRRRPGNWDI